MKVQLEDTNALPRVPPKLDLTKPVCCRSGRKVRIFMTDAGGEYPIIGATWVEDFGYWHVATWTADGCFQRLEYPHLSRFDLVNCEEVPA